MATLSHQRGQHSEHPRCYVAYTKSPGCKQSWDELDRYQVEDGEGGTAAKVVEDDKYWD